MSLELWNTFGTFATFVVISATAIAAVVQLRHMRGSNQIAAFTELRESAETPQFQAAIQFVQAELAERMQDPEFRYQLAHRAERTSENQSLISKAYSVGNFYEDLAVLVKNGLIDNGLVMDLYAKNITGNWEQLARATSVLRRSQGAAVWENFEYLVVQTQRHSARSRSSYPFGMPHIDLPDELLEIDREYETSRARPTS